MARVAALALILALAIGGTAIQGAAAAGGAISLTGVTVSVLEARGSVAGKHSVKGPDAGLRLSLDHTRTLKVGVTARCRRRGTPRAWRCFKPALMHNCAVTCCG